MSERCLLFLGIALLAGCSGAQTSYMPRLVARGELSLQYDDGLEIWTGKKRFTRAPDFDGLSGYVRCVPPAYEHAEQAESDGKAAIGTGITGSILGVGSLSGLSGLAFIEKDETKMWALFGTGFAIGLTGITMSLISRSLKNSANGHAVDAVNYYNDEVGYYGGTCSRSGVSHPAVVPVPQQPMAPAPPPPGQPPVEVPVKPPVEPPPIYAPLPVPPGDPPPEHPDQSEDL